MRGIKIYGISHVPKGMWGEVGIMQACYMDKEKAEEVCKKLNDENSDVDHLIVELMLAGVAALIKEAPHAAD